MNKIILVLLGLMSSFSGAQASQSIYSKISDLYSTGTLINLESFDGMVVSGRCFSYREPNEPKASFVAIRKLVSDVGPIAEPTVTFYLETWYHPSRPANTYDHLSVDQIETLEHFQNWSEVNLQDPRTHIIDYKNKTSAYFRMNGNYIIKNATSSTNTTEMFCYYFLIGNN